jgi:hypothetical protein
VPDLVDVRLALLRRRVEAPRFSVVTNRQEYTLALAWERGVLDPPSLRLPGVFFLSFSCTNAENKWFASAIPCKILIERYL